MPLKRSKRVQISTIKAPKPWTTKKADKLFSEWIRKRDGKCLFSGRTDDLQCSHFWTRGISATRYDPDNCITLTKGEHFKHEKMKQGYYQQFMRARLGEEGYQNLYRRAHTTMKRREAIDRFRQVFLSSGEKKNRAA